MRNAANALQRHRRAEARQARGEVARVGVGEVPKAQGGLLPARRRAELESIVRDHFRLGEVRLEVPGAEVGLEGRMEVCPQGLVSLEGPGAEVRLEGSGHAVPARQHATHTSNVHACLDGQGDGLGDAPLSLIEADQLGLSGGEGGLSDALLSLAAALEPRFERVGWMAPEETLVAKLAAQGEEALQGLVVSARRAFLEALAPRHLPLGWRVDHRAGAPDPSFLSRLKSELDAAGEGRQPGA